MTELKLESNPIKTKTALNLLEKKAAQKKQLWREREREREREKTIQ